MHTLLLFSLKNMLKPNLCDCRCVYSTLINRSYYASYSSVKKWLEENNIIIHPPSYYYKNHLKFKTEHQQVIENIYKYDKNTAIYIKNLKFLRHKADYHLDKQIEIDDVNDSYDYMIKIFNFTLS